MIRFRWLALALFLGAPARLTTSSAEFTKLVDDYLDAFALRHPSIAAGNGLHQHDDRLEDFSGRAIAEELTALRAFERRRAAIDVKSLTPDERVDHRILGGLIDSWILEQETLANWRRNPMLYASAISDGVHNLMTMESDPAPVRMQRVLSKLRGVPALLSAARANLSNPPRIFVERGIGMFRGASGMLRSDLPAAFASANPPAALMTEMRAAANGAADSIDAYAKELEQRVLPRANGSFAIGKENIARRYMAEELIDTPVDSMLALGLRSLDSTEARFRATAAKVDSKRPPIDVWLDVRRAHPKRGEVVAAAQHAVDELSAFVTQKKLASVPPNERVVVASAPPFDLGLASMHSSPPLEARPVKSYFYITDAQPSWTPERQNAWLERFNTASLAIMTSHEVMPGHWLHSVYMRRTPGKLRRIWIGLNPFPQPSSGQDGWAHYAEQLVVDQGFHSDDPRYELAQLSDALTRICRLISGIRLHTGAWTIDDAAKFFEERAHLPGPAARQEAERNTYDPTNGGYFLGKRAAFKLRRDYAARLGPRFDLREFHERVMTNGIAPWWAHRQLLLPNDTGKVLE
jgi:uncharacterized protein (DUF885 family)